MVRLLGSSIHMTPYCNPHALSQLSSMLLLPSCCHFGLLNFANLIEGGNDLEPLVTERFPYSDRRSIGTVLNWTPTQHARRMTVSLEDLR